MTTNPAEAFAEWARAADQTAEADPEPVPDDPAEPPELTARDQFAAWTRTP